MKNAIQKLEKILDTVPAWLVAIPHADFAHSPAPGKWSPKQIIGHLIDSAANNHQRFIRTQFETEPTIQYVQDDWVVMNHYETEPAEIVIQLWEAYNRHLVWVMHKIPESNYHKLCRSGDASPHTLEWLCKDYVDHVVHHLWQIVGEGNGLLSVKGNPYYTH
jgi:DinB superfamily